uniref:Uncharacterized protein n=2 Tax=Anopheles atroparvus TaxID=41427 RepID=A0A182IJD4_ANOAO
MRQFEKLVVLLLLVFYIVRVVEPAIAGDRLVFHVPINYKNVHMTKTRVKPIHHRTFQQTDYKLLGYSTDKHGHGMAPMEYLAKMQILRSPVAARWQSRTSSDITPNAIHEPAVKPAPFSKPPAYTGSSMKRSYYVPTANNLENKLHHFINNLKTSIGASKLAHAVNGVTGAFQQQQAAGGLVSGPGHANNAFRPGPGYYGTGNELRYGQPFVSKQSSTAGHFKSQGFGPKGGQGKRRGHPVKAAPPGKYDSLMSDLGISGYKHFENAVIRDLERREELKVEATIHTLFPDASDDDWRPIASTKKPAGTRPTGPEFSETKVVHALTETPSAKRPTQQKGVNRPVKSKPATSGHSATSSASFKSTVAPPLATGQKHRTKGSLLAKEKRTKESRTKCWNCFNATIAPVTTRHPTSHTTSTRLPTTSNQQPPRYGPTYDAAMFYGSDGKPPATLVGAGAHSYSNVEVHYNRTLAPPFAPGPWTPQSAVEVSTQSAPPVTTLSAGTDSGSLYTTTTGSSIKKSFSKLVKPYGSLAPQADGDTVASTTTHRPTGGSQGTKGTKGPGTKKRTIHKSEAHRRPGNIGHAKPLDSVGAGSIKSEVRVRKNFDAKYSRNRGSIKFKDALHQNPDQIYRIRIHVPIKHHTHLHTKTVVKTVHVGIPVKNVKPHDDEHGWEYGKKKKGGASSYLSYL